MVQIGNGGEVLYGLHFWVQLTNLKECIFPGPAAPIRPFNGHRVSAWRLHDVAFALPWAMDTPFSQTARTSDEDAGGQDILQVKDNGAEARKTVGAPQLMNCGRDMGDHQRESMRKMVTR